MLSRTLILSSISFCISVLPALAIESSSLSDKPFYTQFLTAKDEISLTSDKKLILNCNNGSGQDCLTQGIIYYSEFRVEDLKEHPDQSAIDTLKFQSLNFLEKGCILNNPKSCHYQAILEEEKENIDEAITLYDKACSMDYGLSCNAVVVLKQEQYGEFWDAAFMEHYWKKGCDLNNSQSCNNLGVLYAENRPENNPVIHQNLKKSNDSYKKACDLNNGFGCINLYKSYEQGNGVTVNMKIAFEFAEKACNLENGEGCRILSIEHANGRNGFLKNITKSMLLMKQACQFDDDEACNLLKKSPEKQEELCFSKNKPYDCFDAGWSFEKNNPDRAIKLYTKGCDLDDGGSCNNLAVLLNKKASKEQKMCVHTEKADQLYKKACDLESGYGCLNFADNLSEKPLKNDNIHTVNSYYKKGCDFENTEACVKLGDNYMKQKGLPHDPKKAADLYEQACNDDNKAGCDRIARMYYSGTGRPQNSEKAKDAFMKGCDLGHTEACAVLSLKYKFIKADNIQSKDVKFLNTQCLKHKDANACYILGIWNYQGKGLPKNENKAQDFFQKSCDNHLYDGCIAKKLFVLPEPLRSLSLPF